MGNFRRAVNRAEASGFHEDDWNDVAEVVESWTYAGDSLQNMLYKAIDQRGTVEDLQEAYDALWDGVYDDLVTLMKAMRRRYLGRDTNPEEPEVVESGTCYLCGAEVGDMDKHNTWHVMLDRVMSETARL